jgi:predicted regulator of Ras-like GTPase activity (Roadblock/LC7/MglB family)
MKSQDDDDDGAAAAAAVFSTAKEVSEATKGEHIQRLQHCWYQPKLA